MGRFALVSHREGPSNGPSRWSATNSCRRTLGPARLSCGPSTPPRCGRRRLADADPDAWRGPADMQDAAGQVAARLVDRLFVEDLLRIAVSPDGATLVRAAPANKARVLYLIWRRGPGRWPAGRLSAWAAPCGCTATCCWCMTWTWRGCRPICAGTCPQRWRCSTRRGRCVCVRALGGLCIMHGLC
jgi:hypothetical protein